MNKGRKGGGGKLALRIADDGIGFDTNVAREGMGLALITERASLMKGTVRIVSSEKNGTEVKIELPVG